MKLWLDGSNSCRMKVVKINLVLNNGFLIYFQHLKNFLPLLLVMGWPCQPNPHPSKSLITWQNCALGDKGLHCNVETGAWSQCVSSMAVKLNHLIPKIPSVFALQLLSYIRSFKPCLQFLAIWMVFPAFFMPAVFRDVPL